MPKGFQQTGLRMEEEGGSKPLTATLLQEFQNLKDKFKNDDDSQDRGKLI